MGLYEGFRTVAGAGGAGAIDWNAAAGAARQMTDPGALDLSEADREGYAADVRAARDRVREVAGVDFDVPATVEVQNRHHWIDANAATFRRLLEPIDERPAHLGGPVRVLNTGSMAGSLAFLARNVLGQYDPLLLAGDDPDHGLYVVHPNVVRAAGSLGVDFGRFRRWIAFHEVAHAAEFGAAPWLSAYLGDRVHDAVRALSKGRTRARSFRELDAAMTAVEGYAELLMDRAFDREYDDLRAKLDARRRGGGPLTRVLRRLFGVGRKRRQYERGSAFFEHVVEAGGFEAARAVWDSPEHLPSDEELDDPDAWLARVQYTT